MVQYMHKLTRFHIMCSRNNLYHIWFPCYLTYKFWWRNNNDVITRVWNFLIWPNKYTTWQCFACVAAISSICYRSLVIPLLNFEYIRSTNNRYSLPMNIRWHRIFAQRLRIARIIERIIFEYQRIIVKTTQSMLGVCRGMLDVSRDNYNNGL